MERGAVVTSRGGGRVVLKEDQENAINGKQKGSVREERSVGLRESQATIQELTSQIQELQDRVNLMDDSAEESEGSSSTSRQDSSPYDGEARNHFWSISRNYLYRHHVEPRVKMYVPREESLPIPLRYIDVTRATSTNLDVMLQRRIDDYWKTKETETYQIRGQGSHDSQHWMKNLQMGIHGPGGG